MSTTRASVIQRTRRWERKFISALCCFVRISFCVITGPGREEPADRSLIESSLSRRSFRRFRSARSSRDVFTWWRIAEKVVRRTASAASTHSTPKTIRPAISTVPSPPRTSAAWNDAQKVVSRYQHGFDENLIRAKSVISVYPWVRPLGARGYPCALVYSMCAAASFVRFDSPSSAVTSIITSTPAQLVNAAFHVAFFASHSAVLSTKWRCGWFAAHAVNARLSAAFRYRHETNSNGSKTEFCSWKRPMMRSQNVGCTAYAMPPPSPADELTSLGICQVYEYGGMS